MEDNDRMKKMEFFLNLFYAMNGDIARLIVIWALLEDGADSVWVESSCRVISARYFSLASYRTVQRAIDALIEQKLLLRRLSRNSAGWFKVDIVGIASLIETPDLRRATYPGLSARALPVLLHQRIPPHPTS